MNITSILLLSFVLTFMFLPIILSHVFNFTVFNNKEYFTLSVYGIYMLFYMVIQMFFAFLNKRRIDNISKKNIIINGNYNILVVGYREDPILFEKCLVSIKELNNQNNINKIIIVIDGNEQEDMYMSTICSRILDSTIINLISIDDTNTNVNLVNKFTCVLQPHKGKRHALYTGLKISCDDQLVDGVLCTDSDTELDNDSLYYLANLLESDEKYGGVTGNVQIINTHSYISYMSSIRYWFSCNLERSYQSFNNCVLCISGPLGLYKTNCLSQFLNKWLNQTFLGKECTYGDDRHLTNNILLLGYKVGYTHLATCYTDTPETILRFFTQQVRWCKSSIREFIWNIQCLNKHSIWMSIDLIYQIIYSFIVLCSLIYILYFGTAIQLLIYIIILIVVNGIKGIYAFIFTGSLKYLLYSYYGFIYITLIAPAKLYASISLNDTEWGTSNRLNILNKLELKHMCIFFWNIILLIGIIYNIYHNSILY